MDPNIPPPEIAEENISNLPPHVIRRRAAELAVMDGRAANELTDDDLRRAELEFTARDQGAELPEDTLDPEDAAVSTGTSRTTLDDGTEQPDIVALVESGIERAVEDQFLASGLDTLNSKEEETSTD